MNIEKNVFGNLGEKTIETYKLINDNGMYATFLNLGGTNIELNVKDKFGNLRDVVLQYKNLEDIYENSGSLGAIVARNANRIAGAQVVIDGKIYKLVDNNNGNNLHSGPDVFHKKILNAKTYKEKNEVSVEFSYKFNHMEQGYPGNMDFKICYTLTNDNELKLKYEAISDMDTIFNPTWHSYFNLAGYDFGNLSSHKIKINASKFLYVNDKFIPEKVENVLGTKMDFFSDYKYMTEGINDNYEQIKKAGGYDHNYIINDYDGTLKKAVEVEEDNSGIKMEVWTNLPGVQFYTANSINETKEGKNGVKHHKQGSFCLETQYFPNAINDDRFLSPLIKKGEKKILNSIYKFL